VHTCYIKYTRLQLKNDTQASLCQKVDGYLTSTTQSSNHIIYPWTIGKCHSPSDINFCE
jgi:hypothetical protein